MTEFVLLIYVQEELYGKRMLRYLLGRRNPHLHPELVTSREMITHRTGSETQRLVILTDQKEIKEDGKRIVIQLAETQNRGMRTIFQYQRAESIYEELLALLGMKEEIHSGNNATILQKRRGILFFLSPDAVGVTAIATLASQYLGQHGSCLYLNLTGFPVWFGETLCEEPDFQSPGVDELLFMSGREDFAKREREIRKPMGQAFLLPPFCHYKDLLDSTKEDWQVLLERLQMDCGYDSIVVELGPLMEHTTDLLTLGDDIVFLTQPGLLGRIRLKVWKQYCQMEKRKELLQKTKWITLPEEWQEWEEMIMEQPLRELAENNQIMARIKELLGQEGEEDDVCLWEDFGGMA